MKALRAIGARLGGLVVFLLALTAGALVHMSVPAVRRAAVSRVNAALARALPGRVTLERIGALSLTHVDGIDARAEDPDGVPVLRVQGASARLSVVSLLRSLVAGGDVRVELPELVVDRADVNLDADASGALRLERAFVASRPEGSSSSGVVLAIGRARIGHATVHGRPQGAPPVDAVVDALDGAVAVGPGTLAIDVADAKLAAHRVLGDAGDVDAVGDLEVHLARPSSRGHELGARVAFSGAVGSVAGSVSAGYDGGAIDAVVDVPHATPEELRSVWPSCPFAADATAHVEAHGELASLVLRGRATVGSGELTLAGPVTLGDGLHATLHLEASRVDAHALAARAPASELGASADAIVDVRPGGAAAGSVELQFAGGRLGGARLPAAKLSGEASQGADGSLRGHVAVMVREPGAPAQVDLRFAPKGDALAIAFDASMPSTQLDEVARLGTAVKGRVAATAHGTLDLGAGRIEAQIDASANDVSSGSLRLGTAALRARLSGPLASPRLDAQLEGGGLEAPGLAFATMHAEAHGSPTSAPVELVLRGQDTEVSASAGVALASGMSLRDIRVAVWRGGVRARAQAALVRVAGSEVRIDDAVIEGFGTPVRASVRASPLELEVHAEGRHVNLGHVARFARVANPVQGRLSIAADATVRASGASGHVVLDVTEGGFAEWGDAVAHLDATLEHRRAFGTLEAHLGDIAQIQAKSSSLEVAGTGPLRPASWRKAWGALDVQAHVDLGKLAPHLPLDRMRMHGLSGAVDVSARVGRDSADDVTPDVDVVAKTTGLSASGPPDAPWRLEGTETNAHVHVDGRTGFTSLDVQLADPHGALLALAATSDSIPYAALFLTDQPILGLLRAMPFAAKLTVPARDLADFPALLGTRGMHGELAVGAEFSGSLASPAFDAHGSLRRGRTDVTLLALPLDLDAGAHYDGARAEAVLAAQAHGEPVLAAQLAVEAHATDVLDGLRSGAFPWKASGHATLSQFPLQSIAYLDDRQVRGHASGELSLDGLHEDARASVGLTVDDLVVGDVACPARVQASIASGELAASAALELSAGFAAAEARVGAEWGARMVPSIDTSHPIDVSISAKQFRASLLFPLVSRVFAELDGSLDANARLHVDPRTRTIRPEGTIDLRDGLFELSSVGGEFHDATARIELTPDGIVRLEDASAKGLSGKVQLAATARLAGGAFAGARGVIQVPRQQPLPLVLDGVQLGQFDGQLVVAADPSPADSGLAITVDVPTAHLELPIAAAHDVEALGELLGVRVGIQRPGSGFVPVQLDTDDGTSRSSAASGAPLRIAVRLGKDVQVRRGTDLDVRLAGATSMTARPDLHATGQIHLTRGKIEVQGKPFAIEDGLVTFVDDPTNPQVKLRAAWTAADGTTVYADFVGPLKTGKVTLTSDPLLGKTEILSLILFGTADQSPSTASSSSQSNPELAGAAGAAGGAATAPVNRALGGVNQALDNFGLAGGISTKVDTSQATPRPEVEVQIARDISLQIAWVFGVPPPGSNPDTTLFSLNWRFLRQWSMQTTVGDAGTSILDLIWQHRY